MVRRQNQLLGRFVGLHWLVLDYYVGAGLDLAVDEGFYLIQAVLGGEVGLAVVVDVA
jgi:hypothetical protein